ncbi:hypothetical protein I316_06741 [Kwoniella heveanensis BCC8398]|uniref:Major facilitator superfamily (MFS) profile domain-containing protein n=1 Tax=Kwoniella heveanensis BCC8398 TaxID=1296120 RepID=A0A1B9GKA8_9TREE|nr:hypothetical protein I316_06741 [Kwoniella heveanensis BCC8398]
MDRFQDYFDFGRGGVSTGLVFSMWPIAACGTFWLGPIFADKFGRRGGMLICEALELSLVSTLALSGTDHPSTGYVHPLASLMFILGTCLVAFARNYGMLLAGRFVLGTAVGWMQPGGSGPSSARTGAALRLHRPP